MKIFKLAVAALATMALMFSASISASAADKKDKTPLDKAAAEAQLDDKKLKEEKVSKETKKEMAEAKKKMKKEMAEAKKEMAKSKKEEKAVKK